MWLAVGSAAVALLMAALTGAAIVLGVVAVLGWGVLRAVLGADPFARRLVLAGCGLLVAGVIVLSALSLADAAAAAMWR